MLDTSFQPAPRQVDKPSQLIPVGIREASYDSPTFRATATHFSEQVEIIEKWIDAYLKSASRLINEALSLEDTYATFIQRSIPPAHISEAVIDHDYTLVAMKKFGECSKDWWSNMTSSIKKMDSIVIEPIKLFLNGELKNFKDARRNLEHTQKIFDQTLMRHVSQSKTKEPSSLREDAFQLHETRKAYLKASLEFCILAPQIRYSIDKLIIRISFDQWREIRRSSENTVLGFSRVGSEMDRIRGWSKEMEVGEPTFRRELQLAMREIAEQASETSRPSREIEDYNFSTVAFLGSKGPSFTTLAQQKKELRSENQGWLFLRTLSGKPARTSWVRRWFYIKNGIFGWLIQGSQSGGVEESERIGVLLCSVKPAVQEDRRFCFEIKTKNQAILVQAETQFQLMKWLEAFEFAKNRTLKANANTSNFPGSLNPAFAISAPLIPESTIKYVDGNSARVADELLAGHVFDRTSNVTVTGTDSVNLSRGASADIEPSRRSFNMRDENENGRDHATRIMQRFDLTRKPTLQDQPTTSTSTTSGGIASLISASHNILPVGMTQGGIGTPPKAQTTPKVCLETQLSSLAPTTFAVSPAQTNLSKTAVIMCSERSIGHSTDIICGIPVVIMANVLGSNNWEYFNRHEKNDSKFSTEQKKNAHMNSIFNTVYSVPNQHSGEINKSIAKANDAPPVSFRPSVDMSSNATLTASSHRKTLSGDHGSGLPHNTFVHALDSFPSNYPPELKTQDAQFRILFPSVSREDKVLLVFRAMWNSNEQQEFPGRVYVTQRDIFFYSHHLGFVLTTFVNMNNITEITTAPGKDCDFIFLHIQDNSSGRLSRVTIKTFLEPLRLLQSRLNYLIDISQSHESANPESAIVDLINMENEESFDRSPSMESWEEISLNAFKEDDPSSCRSLKDQNLKASTHVNRTSRHGKGTREIMKFHLPSQPVLYEPPDGEQKVIERQYNISPKALFHVIFGDKSIVFPLLYRRKGAEQVSVGPWLAPEQSCLRREMKFQIEYDDVFLRSRQATIVDHQIIDIQNEHISYVVTTHKTLWHLPFYLNFTLAFKIVITHVAKSKCKLTILTKVDWSKKHKFLRGIIERQALEDSSVDAEDLLNILTIHTQKLGPHSRTKRSIKIFGNLGEQTSASIFPAASLDQVKSHQIKQRTLPSILLDCFASIGEIAITSVIIWIFAALKSIWKIASAHKIILTTFLLSVLVNAFFTNRDTSDWWAERKASRFMARLGVSPNQIISRSIYLKDLDEATSFLPSKSFQHKDGKCYSQFQRIINATDFNAPHHMAGLISSDIATQSMARRLRKTRQNLGSYRHKFMIAMRVINHIERQIITAEWENWLADENLMCDQISLLLEETLARLSNGKKSQELVDETIFSKISENDEKRLRELQDWQENYCRSCGLEQELLARRRRDSVYF